MRLSLGHEKTKRKIKVSLDKISSEHKHKIVARVVYSVNSSENMYVLYI